LQKLAGHIHSHHIIFPFILQKKPVNLVGRFLRNGWSFKSSVRQYLAFVRLYQQHTLFSATNAVQVGLFSKVYLFKG